MSDVIQNISISLVREFLKRKGFSITYQALETESPRTESSITNRTELARLLSIEKLLKKNKEQTSPLKTILEVIAQWFLQKVSADLLSLNTSNKHAKVKDQQTSEGIALLEEDELETELLVGQGMEHVMQQPIEVVPPLQPKPPNKIRHRRSLRRASQAQETSQARVQHQISTDSYDEVSGDNAERSRCHSPDEQTSLDKVENETAEASPVSSSFADSEQVSSEYLIQEPIYAEQTPSPSPPHQEPTVESATLNREVSLDTDDNQLERSTEPASTPRPPLKELKRLVLGSASQSFHENWLGQGLGFCDMPAVLYGMVQHRPGTSGLMSVVQGYFLMELLFINSLTRDLPIKRKLSPHSNVRSELLANAISKVLWKCGEGKKVVYALPGDSTIFSGGGRFRPDGITENLVLNTVTSYDDAVTCALQFISYFETDDSSGAILLLYSAVLSRGIELVLDDMDSNETSLINEQGSCSPELVNLLLCGKAASNVLNDSLEFTQGLGKTIVLKGIPSRADMGLLSLLEHINTGRRNSRHQVGTFLKTPKFPIWLCHIEEHYSLVFCINKELISDWKAERRFDLLYYDPLSCMEEPIRLTIDTTSRFFEPPEDDNGVPPLELCIRTKWKDAQIDWNGSEPIAAKSATDLFDDIM
ncbi:probable ubiquitin carboxyl-terminal hydrolase MINDY-4 [Watersipora subatra]|uniref:probable ubiquitin carboxyl-terminal hydrolase MINDY-4 n=1 Tax=Watersipora subatra TaxID=2589382 RepID=UPI00355B9A66